MTGISLFELNSLVKKSITQCMPNMYWVHAELSDIHSNAMGHCYLELLQKELWQNQLVAKARGIIWANVFRILKPYFEKTTGQSFAAGIKVLVKVTVEFHELYGYSLTIHDIDPTYTVGDIIRQRKEILKQLEEEGVLTLNKELKIPLFPKRIAVISSSTAAGYGDFRHQLACNVHKYRFHVELFPAIMQGIQVEWTIMKALEDIWKRSEEFDVVVIIRGGGASSNLSGFDTYMLAAACAQYSLPIITGIGHERDDTILDLVAHTRVKTPTAAAEFLIYQADLAAKRLYELTEQLQQGVSRLLTQEKQRLSDLRNRIPALVVERLANLRMELFNQEHALKQSVALLLPKQKHRLELLRQRITDASPERILQRGYSITLKNGKAVKDISEVQPGDVLVTRLATGEVSSVVAQNLN